MIIFFPLQKEAQQIKKKLSLYYPLQFVFPSAKTHTQIDNFIKKQKPASYYLIQGFACRTGGFLVSHRVANLRAIYLSDFLKKRYLLDSKYLKRISGIVYEKIPIKEYRRIDIEVFANKNMWQRAYETAQAEAHRINEKNRQKLDHALTALSEAEKKRALRQELYFILALLLFLLALRSIPSTLALLKRRKHRLKRKDFKLLQFLTQGKLRPLGGYRAPLPLGSVRAFLENDKSLLYMAKKNKSTARKNNKAAIIPGIDKPFMDKSLKMLCKAPVHALTDITPRHSQLLHEAFGIKTIEDLAKLKYVEIAKAITILAHYEK